MLFADRSGSQRRLVVSEAESGEEQVGPPANDREGAGSSIRDFHWLYGADVFDLPDLDFLPGGLDPGPAKTEVLGFHEHENVA